MEESRLSKQKEELRSNWSGELDCRLFPAEPHPSSTFRRYIHERICSNCSGKNTARSIIRCGRTAGREAAVPVRPHKGWREGLLFRLLQRAKTLKKSLCFVFRKFHIVSSIAFLKILLAPTWPMPV